MTAPVLVIGAGVGGIAAAIWLHDLAVDFDWVEASDMIGGTLLRVGNPVDELPGLPPVDGPALVARYQKHLDGLAIAPTLKRRVARLRSLAVSSPDDNQLEVHFEDGGRAQYRAVILCTGTTPRLLELPHERALLGRGVELSVTRNRDRYAGQRVAVVGGGDAALEGVLLLTDVCDQIHLIHRRSCFRAQRRFVDQIADHPAVNLHLDTEIEELLLQGETLRGVRLSNGLELPVTGLFVRLGVAPSYPVGLMPKDRSQPISYLSSTDLGRGTLPGTYIVGDVGTASHQSVSWAMGSAARAVASVCRDLGLRSHSMSAD